MGSVTTLPWWAGYLLYAGALTALGACTSLRNLEPPEVVLIGIQPLESTLLEQRFQVDLRIYNPNNRDIDIDGVDFELDINGKRLARGAGAESLLLPRLGEARTSVVVSTSLVSVATQLMTMNQTRSLSYRIKGRLHLGSGLGATLPFKKSGEIGEPRSRGL